MHNRWLDGRSGQSGRYAGNLVLDHLDPGGRRIRHLKGTVFEDETSCWVGRVVADDTYLSQGVLHWANASADQHRELSDYGRATGRELFYLFVTAHVEAKKINYWQVPSAVLERELRRRGKYGRGAVLGLHISARDGRHVLGEEDVTDYHAEFVIDAPASANLASAVRIDRSKKASSTSTKPQSSPAGKAMAEAWQVSQPSTRRFEIPISGGRVATFIAPVSMTAQDVTRVKGFMDLMADLLVS